MDLCASLFGTTTRLSRARSNSTASSRLILSAASGDRYLGEVLWFDTTKKFGFISPSDGSDNTFLHLLDIYSPIAKGQKVTYDLGEDITGRKKAVKVVPFGEVEARRQYSIEDST